MGKTDEQIFMTFLEKVGMRQGTLWDIFGILRLNP